jgi:hypothetical protein
MSSGEARWVLAVDHGTTATVGAVADVDPTDGWVRVGVVGVDGASSMPSVVLSRPDGAVLAGRTALDAAIGDPAAAVLRARSYLASATGGPDDPVLTTWPRPTTAVNAATALVAKVFHTEAARRGTLPAALVLTHPAWWGDGPRAALRAAGRAVLSGVAHADEDTVVLLETPRAAAVRLGGEGPLAVVDVGGGGTEVALVDRSDTGDPVVRPDARAVEVGAEALDDALAQLVLDRAAPDLAGRIRFGGDLDAHRAWFALRSGGGGVRDAKEHLGVAGVVDVPLPVLPPESPGPASVRLTHADLGALFAPGLEEIGSAVCALVGDERPPLLVRGGVSELPGVRDWLAQRTGLALAHGADQGAVSALGAVSGAAAWGAEQVGIGR